MFSSSLSALPPSLVGYILPISPQVPHGRISTKFCSAVEVVDAITYDKSSRGCRCRRRGMRAEAFWRLMSHRRYVAISQAQSCIAGCNARVICCGWHAQFIVQALIVINTNVFDAWLLSSTKPPWTGVTTQLDHMIPNPYHLCFRLRMTVSDVAYAE